MTNNKTKTIAERVIEMREKTGWEVLMQFPCPSNDMLTFLDCYRRAYDEDFFEELKEELGDKFNAAQQFLKKTNDGTIQFNDGWAFIMEDLGGHLIGMYRPYPDGSATMAGKAIPINKDGKE